MRTALTVVGFLSLIGLGCNRVDNAVDCFAVCDEYEDCFDSSFDRSGCYDRCRAQSTLDANHQEKVDACHDCINDRSCREQTFFCATECQGVVP